MRTFSLMSGEKKFSQIWDLSKNTANNTNFHYSTNSVKINDQFFNIFKKPCFDPFLVHFLNFGDKKVSPQNPALSCTTLYRFLAPCQNLEKTNDIIPRKRQ